MGYSISFKPGELGYSGCLDREWLLTNGLGGYSSSTITGLNSRKYHGLLVSGFSGLRRWTMLQKLEDEVSLGDNIAGLSVDEYGDGTVRSKGRELLDDFRYDFNSVYFKYRPFDDVSIEKTLNLIKCRNALVTAYSVGNKSSEPVSLKVTPLINSRSIHSLTRENQVNFNTRFFESDNVLEIESNNAFLVMYSDKTEFKTEPGWHMNLHYRLESQRGEDCTEDCFYPGHYSITVDPDTTSSFRILALGCETRDEAVKDFRDLIKSLKPQVSSRVIGGLQETEALSLLSAGESFIVDALDGKKTVLAGYHWFGEWGRDALISLPGLTLVNGRLDDAEKILEHFLNKLYGGRIPTRVVDGRPEYRDFDSTLWLIDRVNEYLKYAGLERGFPLLRTYWWSLKEIVECYKSQVKDGILHNNPDGTWMDTLERPEAVEIQALWYNALKIMEKLSEYMEDDVDYGSEINDIEKNFILNYWSGMNYLRDSRDDNSLRPNQLIALSLEHTLVDDTQALLILDAVEEKLLTPCGPRTLDPGDNRYSGVYEGGPSEREKAYHNGCVWPWLLGPYVKACMRYKPSKRVAEAYLRLFFETQINQAGLGTISELFDGSPPHKPRGCISQAWSIAEPLRAYHEDVLGRKPQERRV